MGSWHLEVFKMAVYITFPVGLFHYFNQPSFFKSWVENSIQDIHKPETPATAEFREKLRQFKEQQQREMQIELEKQMA